MNFDFDWGCTQTSIPYVTINEVTIAFNSKSIRMLGNAEKISIGFDAENMVIGFKEYTGEPGEKPYKFYKKISNGWIRIGCVNFISNLSKVSGMQFKSSVRYEAKYDADKNIMYISVLEPIKKGGSNSGERKQGVHKRKSDRS